MACSTASTHSSMRMPATSSPQSLIVDNLRKHIKATGIPSKKRKISRPVSPERTFLCQDKNYPRSKPKPLLQIQKAYARSGPSVHWRGDDRALYNLDPSAKYNIRDYLLEQCKATTQTTNELTKPTGTKTIFVFRFNDDDREQEALCVQTNAATLHGVYNFRNVHPSIKNASAAPKMLARSTENAAPRGLPRSRGTTSLTGLMAGVNEEDFPLPDRELDSDSDSDEETAPPPYSKALTTTTEGKEDEEGADGFVNVVDIGAPKYCRDPHSINHPECHGRYNASSYAHSVFDAGLDFQERFVTAHSGHGSAAYYCNWRILKHDHGEIMVHGQSALRNTIASPKEDDEEGDSDYGLDDATEQLLRLIDAKFGPLTLEGQKVKPAESATKYAAECIAKINEYIGRDPYEDPRLPGQSFDVENADVVSEPGTVFEGVADLSDDDNVPTPTSTSPFAQVNRMNAPVMTEAELEELINTSHEDFINSYVQRYEAMRSAAARAMHGHGEAHRSSVPPGGAKGKLTVAPDAVVEQVVALPELVVTAATPVSSPARDVVISSILLVEGHETAVTGILCAPLAVTEAVVEQTAPAQPCDVTALASTCITIEAIPAETSARPTSVQSMCSSRDESSCPASVFSRQTSVTTKPSNESIWSDNLCLVETLDLRVEIKPTPTFSQHERSVSMPTLTVSSPHTSETSIDVSESNQSAHAQATYVVPCTPVRAAPAMNKRLTLIVEVQTPRSTSTMPPTMMHASTVMEDPHESIPTPVFNHPQPYPHASHACVPHNDPAERMPASVFTDDSSFTDQQAHSNKLAAGIKHRARAVASVTKQTTQCTLRSLKKLRATAHYFAAAFSSRNPFETVARR